MKLKARQADTRSKIEITDDDGNVMYYLQSRAFSFHDTSCLLDADGGAVATITRNALSLYDTHLIVMNSGTAVELRAKRLRWTKNALDIGDLGWRFAGGLAQRSYQLTDDRGQVLARTRMKRAPFHKACEVEVLDEERMDLVVAVLVVLNKIMAGRAGAEAVFLGRADRDGAQN